MVRIDIVGFEENTQMIISIIRGMLDDLKKNGVDVCLFVLPEKIEKDVEPCLKMICSELLPVIEILSAFGKNKFCPNVNILAGGVSGYIINADNVAHTIPKIKKALATESKFIIGERVQCQDCVGVIKDIQLIYYNYGAVWTWGYEMNWDDKYPSVTFFYVPQEHLQKIFIQ